MTVSVHPSSKRIVLAHGVFDVLHLGHVRYLEAASKLGDELVVSVTSDQYAAKGPDRPVLNHVQRSEMLRSIACVGRVVINDHPNAVPIIEQLRPAVYVKGAEYATGKGDIQTEIDAVERCGGKVVFHEAETFSSSAIINRHLDVLDPAVKDYLESARDRGFAEMVPGLIESIRDMSVLFIGETILDEYVYVTPLGKPPKEWAISCRRKGVEVFRGGVEAAAHHVDSFVSKHQVMSWRTVTKRRFVDQDTNRKLFEEFDGNDAPTEPHLETVFIDALEEMLPKFDVVVVTDFGHGMLTKRVRTLIEDCARYLAVNTQSNSANHGFNLLNKWNRWDYACLDLPEARLLKGQQYASAEELALPTLTITDGRRGSVVWPHSNGLAMAEPVRIPAFTTKAVDTMGAGDAFLAVTAPLMAAKGDPELVGFIGNVVGAIKVGTVGHRKPVDKETVLRYAGTLLK